MSDAPIPSVVAMLICERVIVEQGTGAKSLIGVFENLNSPFFPAPTHISLYAKLLDADGHYNFLVRLVSLLDEMEIVKTEAPNVVAKPPNATEIVINFAGLPLPSPGKYEFQLWADGIFLHRATMNAILIQGGPQWPQPQSRQ
jgi:hypothetical protein